MALFNGSDYELVISVDNTVIQDKEGNVLVQNKKDKSVMYVDYFVAVKAFNLKGTEDALQTSELQHSSSACSASSNDKENRNPWTKNEILQLLSLYKSYNHLFKSTIVKNDKVWSMISGDLKSYTTEQCKNKFKYLKQKYVKKKDNMSTKASGAANIKFEFFYEMDDIFKDDKNIVPVSVASSSRGEYNLNNKEIVESNEESDSTDNSNCNVKGDLLVKSLKRKRTQMEEKFDNLEKNLQRREECFKQREELKNQRHKEIIERQDSALLEKITDCFIKIANKN